jgi:hypothetical protein
MLMLIHFCLQLLWLLGKLRKPTHYVLPLPLLLEALVLRLIPLEVSCHLIGSISECRLLT